MFVTTIAGPKPAVEAARPALEAIWGRLAPHINGAYANFLASAAEEDVAAIYPTETYQQLQSGQASVRPRQSVRPQAQPQRPASVSLGRQAKRRPRVYVGPRAARRRSVILACRERAVSGAPLFAAGQAEERLGGHPPRRRWCQDRSRQGLIGTLVSGASWKIPPGMSTFE